MTQVTILGAGISGLSTSYLIGHERCLIFEAKPYYGGHIYSDQQDGFTWDDGPHVSFTDNEFVRDLFAESVQGEFEEFPTVVSNYYRGHWIEHPAQSNLYQVPEPLRTRCLESFLEMRSKDGQLLPPKNYQEWIHQAFGPVFADTFPAAYTRKYWTTEPVNLGVDWIGKRVFYPSVEDVTQGSKGPLDRKTYWVKKFRYPSRGGFLSYSKGFARGARIHYGKEVVRIDLDSQKIWFADGREVSYEVLVSTLPLPILIRCCAQAPVEVREAVSRLRCTRFYLVEVAARHPARRDDQWLYVYDEDKLSTRVSITEHFSPHNAPKGCTGMSVEVYGSDYRELPEDREEVARRVQEELVEMGLLDGLDAVLYARVRFVPWGNVIFDHERQAALDVVDEFLDRKGVVRVGRFAEWKYLMTHDCVLRSLLIAKKYRQGAFGRTLFAASQPSQGESR